MKELLAKLLERKNLSQEEAREMILWVMSEAVSYTHLTLPTNREV